MRTYELSYLIDPEISRQELADLTKKISDLIEKEGGQIQEKSLAFRRQLAYPIRKKNQAFLVSLDFYLEPSKIPFLEKKIKEEEKIFRYLIFSKKKKILPLIPKKIVKKKVELKELEKKLEEILGQ